MILGLSSHGVPVTGWTTSSVDALKAECRLNFGVEPDDGDIKATSFIKIAWILLLLVWAWERMPFLAPVLTAPSFPLSRRLFCFSLQFLWTPYDEHRLGPNVVPDNIYTRADLWNAPSPLISFECVEWCPTDRVMRQFGLAQSFPAEPRSLANKHNECLTGPKCKNWRNEHRDLIGEWLNRVPMWVPGYPPHQ
ncbi:hypothetical protein PIB30_024095 [Stylosanthes scabra]|uniref:Aminotransferase-like plant mobile domain-containing protein n=1 Tax=Stylosanthes scabra TaxID=79078 RepID=A0ABU6U8M7_9FABA|nr:hypothetical protein [Stylosanthes scabra]